MAGTNGAMSRRRPAQLAHRGGEPAGPHHAARVAAYAVLMDGTKGDAAAANRLWAELTEGGPARPDEADEYAQGPPDRVWSRELLLGEELEAWVRHVGDCISWAICHQLFDAGNPVEFDDGMAIEFDDRIAQLASVIDQLGAARLGGGGTDRAAWQATYASLRQWFPAMNTRAGRELAAGLMNDRLADPDADPVAVPAGSAA